jgi:hypothetical protein
LRQEVEKDIPVANPQPRIRECQTRNLDTFDRSSISSWTPTRFPNKKMAP